RGTDIKIIGEEENVESAYELIKQIMPIAKEGDVITKQNITYLASIAKEHGVKHDDYPIDYICLNSRGNPVKSKTYGQKKYVNAIKGNDIVFSIGPAGTGKTFLAIAMAVTAFRKDEFYRIILTRPAVEAGEKLGFLPGDLQSKIDPYLRPLYDALFEIMGSESFQRNKEKGLIEIVPLAYMRGRTLDNSFIILDEAQNTTPQQMKMFLTRMGFGSKVIITGDVTQIDLPDDRKSGLVEAERILKNIEGISFVKLTEKDVVRHELVQKIIKAYDKHEASKSRVKKQ
ncbi:MAG: PhoH family protein, partial [Clostridia bacterium]|nr:PhoH family protein [Clostridia bacterium]